MNLRVNQGLPTTLPEALGWATGIAAATWLSWWVGRRLEAYAKTTEGQISHPYHPRQYF